MTELKPCPFCGGEARTLDDMTPRYWYIQCLDCEMEFNCSREVYHFDTEQEAIDAWDTRPTEDFLNACLREAERYWFHDEPLSDLHNLSKWLSEGK